MSKIFHIVLGNQSGDLDSIASSLALTSHYLRTTKDDYAPFFNFPHADLVLRKDVLHVLKTLNLNPDNLLFADHIPSLWDHAKEKELRIILVDHNRLAPGQEEFRDHVERIIDHHKDEHIKYPLLIEKKISMDGSNCTQIGSMLLEQGTCTREIAYLLLAAILLDTGNLKNPQITTNEDIRISTLLKEKAGSLYSDDLYDILFELRHDVKDLSASDLLRKDYKLYQEGNWVYGIASLPRDVFWDIENRNEWKNAVVDVTKSMVGVLGYAKNGHDKIFIVYIPDSKDQAAFLESLKNNRALKDEMILREYFPDEGLMFFNLRTPLKRKHLQPLLHAT